MKKIISVLLAIFTFSICITGYATDKPEFAVSSANAKPGETLEITVSVKNNPGISSLKTYVSFDSILELEKVEYNSAFSGQTLQPSKMASPVTLIWISPFANCKENGIFATLTFKVKSTAKAGDVADISLSYDPNDVYDLSETNIDFAVTSGKITVANNSNVSVTGVKLNKNETSIKAGESESVSATVSPENATNKKVVWKSNDESVATVENGTVTGVSKGSTRITATTEDGGFMASCEVTVNCSHKNKTKVSAKESTCDEQGWDEYYECDDCGQTFLSDGTTEVTDRPFRPFGKHSGGTATCQELAVCDHCSAHYGDYGSCNYSAKIEKEEAIKTPGNCTTKAEYYYCCSVCGECEHNDNHTFIGSDYCHSFTNYVYNNDATTEYDGTETAKCDYCSETQTRTAIGTQIKDDTVDEKVLSEAKLSAIAELNEAKKNYNKEDAKKIIDEAIGNISKATTVDAVSSIKSKALSEANKANILLDSVVINVASEKKIDYRSKVIIKATAKNLPEGYYLVMSVNGKEIKGSNTEVSYEVSELKSDVSYTVKVVNSNGNIQKDSTGNELKKDGGKITCNAGFFKKIIAFFKGLFKSLPKVEVKP